MTVLTPDDYSDTDTVNQSVSTTNLRLPTDGTIPEGNIGLWPLDVNEFISYFATINIFRLSKPSEFSDFGSGSKALKKNVARLSRSKRLLNTTFPIFTTLPLGPVEQAAPLKMVECTYLVMTTTNISEWSIESYHSIKAVPL